jgi:hypothetical protein
MYGFVQFVLLAACGGEYEDGSYRETGNSPGAEFLVRLYPGGKGHKGFCVGGALGLWNTNGIGDASL